MPVEPLEKSRSPTLSPVSLPCAPDGPNILKLLEGNR
jgi:hypothetical protein